MELLEKDIPCSRRVIINGKIKSIKFSKGLYEGAYKISTLGQELTDQLEYHEELGVYNHMSDDGEEFYFTVYVFDDGEIEDMPDQKELMDKMMPALQEMVMSVAAGETYSEDLKFAMEIFKNPAMIYRTWRDNGKDIEKAQKEILKNIFDME